MAVGKLSVRSCLIDGEVVFDFIHRRGALACAALCAFVFFGSSGFATEKRKWLLAKLTRAPT
jgi:hypothetical protein